MRWSMRVSSQLHTVNTLIFVVIVFRLFGTTVQTGWKGILFSFGWVRGDSEPGFHAPYPVRPAHPQDPGPLHHAMPEGRSPARRESRIPNSAYDSSRSLERRNRHLRTPPRASNHRRTGVSCIRLVTEACRCHMCHRVNVTICSREHVSQCREARRNSSVGCDLLRNGKKQAAVRVMLQTA